MGTFMTELWDFLRVRKTMWVTPIIAIMIFLVILMIVASSNVVAPYVYALF
jgi:Family of unknown function (DUF5989)